MAVKTITIDELDGLGIDHATDELYWKGKKVRMGLRLPVWVEWSAILVAAAALVQALANAMQAADVVVKWLK
jgi:hypothetical protein